MLVMLIARKHLSLLPASSCPLDKLGTKVVPLAIDLSGSLPRIGLPIAIIDSLDRRPREFRFRLRKLPRNVFLSASNFSLSLSNFASVISRVSVLIGERLRLTPLWPNCVSKYQIAMHATTIRSRSAYEMAFRCVSRQGGSAFCEIDRSP